MDSTFFNGFGYVIKSTGGIVGEAVGGEYIKDIYHAVKDLNDRIDNACGRDALSDNQLVEIGVDSLMDMAGMAAKKFLSPDGAPSAGASQFGFISQQAVKAGLSAAVITMAMEAAPILYRCINDLVNKGAITNESLEELGGKALAGSANGFLRGANGFLRGVIAGVAAMAVESKFGKSMQSVSPSLIGALSVIMFQTLQDSISVVRGSMTRVEMLNRLNNSLFVAGCSIGMGVLFQYCLSAVPFAYLAGNMVGTFVGSYIYNTADRAIMALAIENGWTVFKLVDHDYQLPDEVLAELGLDLFDYENYFPEEIEYDAFEYDTIDHDLHCPEMVRILRRGVIAVHQVGYVK